MAPSVLDYEDRPSKTVARRIFVDVLKRLQVIDTLAKYSYVGFGAYQFLDFDLVHRQLGLSDMVSIESNEKLIARCHFNAPYKNIKILQGTAGNLIPTLEWSKRTIVWLDYTQRLRKDELADCENVALRLQPGSVLAITLNCQSGDDKRRADLAAAVGAENVPIGTTEAKLGDWGLAKTQRELVTEVMHRTLGIRGDGTTWQQLLNLNYRDGARMQMVVGIVDHPELHAKIEACRFFDMAEVSGDADPIIIEMPTLTLRERQALGKKLPAKTLTSFAGISEGELASYARFYRWLDAAG